MAQCKTRADLHREYARVCDMCNLNGSALKSWECVISNVNSIGDFYFVDEPQFTNPPESYRFALAVVEGKPVFPGDVLYIKSTGDKTKVTENDTRFCCENLSWNPPQPKKLVLNGVELPMPSFDYGKAGLVLHFDFKSEEDEKKIKKLFFELITNQENVK